MSNFNDSESLLPTCVFIFAVFMLCLYGYMGYLIMTDDPLQDQRVIGKWVSSDFDGEKASYIFEFSAGGSGIYYQNGVKYLCKWDKSTTNIYVSIYMRNNSTMEITLRNKNLAFNEFLYNSVSLYKVTENV